MRIEKQSRQKQRDKDSFVIIKHENKQKESVNRTMYLISVVL